MNMNKVKLANFEIGGGEPLVLIASIVNSRVTRHKAVFTRASKIKFLHRLTLGDYVKLV